MKNKKFVDSATERLNRKFPNESYTLKLELEPENMSYYINLYNFDNKTKHRIGLDIFMEICYETKMREEDVLFESFSNMIGG